MSVLLGRNQSALISFIGTLILVGYLAHKLGGFNIVLPDLWLFATLQLEEIAINHSSFLKMLGVILAVLVIDLPCSIGASMILAAIIGEAKGGHKMEDLMDLVGRRRIQAWLQLKAKRLKQLAKLAIDENVGKKRQEKNFFMELYIIVLAEELFARWLFLGVLHSKIWFLSGSGGFLILFLLGNSLWALAHLNNYRKAEDRHPLRVAPQFVSGIFFSYVFVKYGLTASVLTHFAANAILFSLHKHQRFDAKDIVLIAIAGVYAAVSYSFIDRPLSDLLQWINDEPVFNLEGWSSQNYIALGVFIPTFLSFLFGILLYDRSNIELSQTSKADELNGCTMAIAGSIGFVMITALSVTIVYISFWLLGFVIVSVPIRITLLAVMVCFLRRGSSGSSASNTFWTALPEVYASVCIIEALSFFNGVFVFGSISALLIPFHLLKKWDD